MTLDAPTQEIQTLIDMGDHRLLGREAKPHRTEHRCHLGQERFGLRPVAGHHDHEVVRVPDEPVVGESVPTPFRSFHGADRVLVEVLRPAPTTPRWPAAATGCHPGVPVSLPRYPSGENPRFQEGLDQQQHAFVRDPATHPVYQGRVVDPVETRLDVALDNPLIEWTRDATSRSPRPEHDGSDETRRNTGESPLRRSAPTPASGLLARPCLARSESPAGELFLSLSG